MVTGSFWNSTVTNASGDDLSISLIGLEVLPMQTISFVQATCCVWKLELTLLEFPIKKRPLFAILLPLITITLTYSKARLN